MCFTNLFHEALFFQHCTYPNHTAFFCAVSDKLERLGFVEPTFQKAIITREAMFPTGLRFPQMAIAIPHTDCVHVKKPFIAVSKLAVPVSFVHMGSYDEQIAVSAIWVLGIKFPETQASLLADLMDKFNSEVFVKRFKEIDNAHDMQQFLTKQFGGDNK